MLLNLIVSKVPRDKWEVSVPKQFFSYYKYWSLSPFCDPIPFFCRIKEINTNTWLKFLLKKKNHYRKLFKNSWKSLLQNKTIWEDSLLEC